MPRDHQFQVIEFIQGQNDALPKVAIVLTLWTESNNVTYMEPPYEPEDQKLIDDLIQKKSPAPESWSKYKFKFLDSAPTLKEAKTKLKKQQEKINNEIKDNQDIDDMLNDLEDIDSLSSSKNSSEGESINFQTSGNDLAKDSNDTESGNDQTKNHKTQESISTISSAL